MTHHGTSFGIGDGREQFPNHRYASLVLGDDSVLVYDVEYTTRWIQSDTTVSREEMR